MIRHFDHRHPDKTLEIFYMGFDHPARQVKFSKYLEGKDREAFLKIYNKLPDGLRHRCHVPHHGFRIINDGVMQFECEICFRCDSMFFDGPAAKVSSSTFDSASVKAEEMWLFFENHLGPHPFLKDRE